MNLPGYQSECNKHQKMIVCIDSGNPQKYIAQNVNSNVVYKYRIDGDVITNGARCDYLVINSSKAHLYYIELKGSDLNYALEQLVTSERNVRIRFYKDIGKCKLVSFRVVFNRTPATSLYSNDVKRFKKKYCNIDLKYKSKVFEEKI